MAETLTIPQQPSLVLMSPQHKPLKDGKPPLPATAANTKRKQSKSRNGCVTCKAKRLKCDESKPTCQQCARRAVACGGYKKDFKWRPFEEPNLPNKQQGKSRKDSGLPTPNSAPVNFQETPIFHEPQYVFSSPVQHVYYPPHPSPFTETHSPVLQTSFANMPLLTNQMYSATQSPYMTTPTSISPVDLYPPGYNNGHQVSLRMDEISAPVRDTRPSSPSGQSPRLVDILIPGTDLSKTPPEYSQFLSQHHEFYQPTGLTPPPQADDDIEEISRNMDADAKSWIMQVSSPAPSNSSASSSDSPDLRIIQPPRSPLTSAETLTRRYDRDTCGVLSVKDGPTENPWRTLVWPLTRDCPALYHAISAMTSFHHSKDMPLMRIQGIDHFKNAVHALRAGLRDMRFDTAISTTLVLAFSESWDRHISTGINHIKGAKILINQALVEHRLSPKQGEEWTRLKFLCNTWIYMDVIARLTSADDDESNDVDAIHDSVYTAGEEDKLDPLMGCASTLFPIIGRVANLVKRVRRTDGNGPAIVSQAVQLKSQLETWTPPSHIEDPEDETTSAYDSIRTATAYQYATLLYLHQAVPEIPSESSSVLAKKVLCELANVEPTSRSVIVHIYPLMAAGCEAMDREDREWVKERWSFMSSRMKLGIIEKCLDVTKEVWNRRDEYAADFIVLENMQEDNYQMDVDSSSKRNFDDFFNDLDPTCDIWLDSTAKRRVVDPSPSYNVSELQTPSTASGDSIRKRQGSTDNLESLDFEFTVKGRLHWLGVMKDWNWEVLLG